MQSSEEMGGGDGGLGFILRRFKWVCSGEVGFGKLEFGFSGAFSWR